MSRVGQSPRSCSGKGQGRQITSKNVCEGRGLGGGRMGRGLEGSHPQGPRHHLDHAPSDAVAVVLTGT